jgi:exodeoxyribonuclease VII large subunit
MPTVISISQLISDIKSTVQGNYALQDVWVQGEVSQFTQAAGSGHCYFRLKDGAATLECVMWRGQAAFLRRLPAHGDLVQAHGKVDVYPAQGRLQLVVDLLQPAGLGQLNQAFEALKARLAAEGLFDPARKRPLPAWPQRVGIVTSADAAALRDILRTLKARFPLVDVLLASTLVQGSEAPAQIEAAIQRLNRWSATVEPIDVLIVARGGGSLEELWAFNEERVVRALARSAIPVVSGVGHEVDFTMADFVADVRAPTPTAAAALVVPDQRDLAAQLAAAAEAMTTQMQARLAAGRREVQAQRRLLLRVSPQQQIAYRRQRIDELLYRGQTRFQARIALARARILTQQARIAALNPQRVLARGYAIVQVKASGAVVRQAAQVTPGERLRVQVTGGAFEAEVTADDI